MVHNNVDDTSSIGHLAKWATEVALEAGMRVTLVAAQVDPQLAREVTVRPLYVPPRLHLLQWVVARPTIRRAMGPGPYDLVHVHQPQVAALADIWQVHFLSRASADAGGLAAPDSARGRIHRIEQQGVVRAEDHYLRRLPPSTQVVFCSEWLREQFVRYYPMPTNQTVLTNPGPASLPDPGPEARRLARRRFGVPEGVPVVGYLGGTDSRKGYRELVERVAAEPGVHLLFAGAGSETYTDPAMGGRLHTCGWLDRDAISGFLHAVDVLAVPSRFDPWGVVVNEACAAGIPVLASPSTGASADVGRSGAGLVWDARSEPLGPALEKLSSDPDGYRRHARQLADRLSYERQATGLLHLYDRAIDRRRSVTDGR